MCSSAALVDALHNPACYAHPVDRVKLVETHISWVFLAGKYAYKLKKPVNFGFLDFSTPDKRAHFCREELRLNRRFAPQLYLAVVSIGGDPAQPVLGGTPAIDYLVKMRRFPRQNELDQLLETNQLSAEIMEQFAEYLAEKHQQAPFVDPRRYFGSLDAVLSPVQENFQQLSSLLADQAQRAQLVELENSSRKTFEQLTPLLKKRKELGFIRECHGDVHLANMVWLDQQPILFDCIEFNENFRCIDLVNDYAFLLMDLEDRNAAELGWHFLNRYLRQTGDYLGLRLLNFYKSYRAMVRAKVIGLRLHQDGLSTEEREFDRQLLQSYLDLADSFNRRRNTPLIISHGPSGSGKTTFISQLAPSYGAVSIHSDIERKRLHGMSATATSDSGPSAGIYTEQSSQQTYRQLAEAAETAIRGGFPAIVDATFLQQQQREQMRTLATRLKIPFFILDFPLSESDLYDRVKKRQTQAEQISEATTEILKNQIKQAQPLTAAEQVVTITVGPEMSPDRLIHLLESDKYQTC